MLRETPTKEEEMEEIVRSLENIEFQTITGQTISYFQLAVACLRQPPAQGFSVGDMKDRLDCLSIIEQAADKPAEFTARQSKALKDSVQAMKWGVLERGILEFCEAVLKQE